MKAISLISSGIDSPVASYMMMRKGVELVFLYNDCDHDPRGLDKVRQLIARLDSISKKAPSKLVVNDYMPRQKKVMENTNRRFQCILCKRGMYLVAQDLAQKEGAKFILTGESMGQVASQTLDNLSVLDTAVTIPIVRPLIGFDKKETMDIAKKIGTYDISIQKSSSCPYVPDKPATKARLDLVEAEEKKIL